MGACDEVHTGLPGFGARSPEPWFEASKDARAGGYLRDDRCVLGLHRFVRCTIDVPILGSRQRMSWGVWSSLSPASFDRVNAAGPDELLGPMFGWLSTQLASSLYPSTFALEAHLYTRPAGRSPLLILEPTDHPLALDQRRGITADRAIELATSLLAQYGGSPA
ncbi:MAG TPA: DUF2199 domain-containing protein [Kofleriaceae bacterium]|nr:DUF2199 domain-containing protein [Kofleriaceae bacterium]